ncbi:MAG TPA: diguanylate cyclase, partial [Lachnospiraceae bacterium]|nr:diguanylate cyclase [Lachnospiraceae bacterium]
TLGDTLLKEISDKMNGIMKDGIHLVRLGGDEFVFFYENISDKKEIEGKRLILGWLLSTSIFKYNC